MDGAESDHSMTWEDFFGSTSDLTPTLIGIYDSLLEPCDKQAIKQAARLTSNQANKSSNQNLQIQPSSLHSSTNRDPKKSNNEASNSKLETKAVKIPGGIKLPLHNTNKSALYSRRTNLESVSVQDGAISVKNLSVITDNEKDTSFLYKMQGKTEKIKDVGNAFDNLSPNVKRILSSADTTTANTLKQRKTNVRASVRGHKSNIPLVGATSKISQSGVDILDSVEIYDQPAHMKARSLSIEDKESPVKLPPKKHESPTKELLPQFRLENSETYDIPSNRLVIYDVPSTKTAFESLSLPYIDQSIELNLVNDREFDTKVITPENLESTIIKNDKKEEILQDSPPQKIEKPEAIAETMRTGNPNPEKDSRLVAPTVEVTRPLSMSSIASSSSTSSSGVQNKGVNSAYLASIESLDDHSDADITSANSNNFVNSTGMLNAASEENRGGKRCELTQLERVCAEIVETENVYVEDLRQVVEGYLHVWRASQTFSTEDLAELFNNIEDIYAFNRSLCEGLNTCQLDPISLARQFVENTSGFSVYTSYCTGYPQTMSRLASMASCAVGARECRERQTALQHALPLGSYLLKPVQRILKYHLLLQNLVKQCRSPETEYALLKMTGIAQHIDDMKRKHEHAVRVQEIQSLLYGWSGPDLTTFGELCAEGTFRVFGAKAMRHAFLFDKMLLLTKNREDGILAYKSHIMCNNLMLVESIAGAPLSFHVIPWDAPRAQLTLQARSQRHKREWTLLLKRVILENYNAVIPSHARQLVMELGQNKTDDDILAEKSRNLITNASMRKQLSAPEYLEKRKLERERRKTCENRLKPIQSSVRPSCDCEQVSAEKGTDFTCDICYIDLCSDCDAEFKDKECSSKDKECTCKDKECNCKDNAEKCPECDRRLHFIDAGSAENLERKQSSCKCPDFKTSQESFREYSGTLNGRGYHSSDNIPSYTDKSKEAEKSTQKTCLKCAKIKENIAFTEGGAIIQRRKSRCNDLEKKTDTLRSKSKDDSQRSKLSKISTWRRKSEPGLENGMNIPGIVSRKINDEKSIDVAKGYEKIEFECRNCGSTKVNRKQKVKNDDSDQGLTKPKVESKSNVEVRMYNTKHVPKKISKLRKSRAKGIRLGADMTAKFYADFSTDISAENILHISESTDSINTIPKEYKEAPSKLDPKVDIEIDEETYKKLIEKTDSFKKNELEKVKYLNQQKVINEGAEYESDKQSEPGKRNKEEESGEESEKPLELIISQLLMQNREFQKILKKQQQRNGAQRRNQRLLKSHSNPEQTVGLKNKDMHKIKPKYGRQTSENLKLNTNPTEETFRLSPQKEDDNDHIYETLRVEPVADSSEARVKEDVMINQPQSKIPPLLHDSKNNERHSAVDSDYVYLSFDKLKEPTSKDNGVYDVPSSIPVKIPKPTPIDYYVTVNKKHNGNIYDCVDAQSKDKENNISTGEYLSMNKDQQNPNTPEIWLSRQKEHFTVSRDRKSGSLPRSFQAIPGSQEDKELSTFKNKTNVSHKTYLNRDGKVLSMDRPFTIASDKSEISYDDVETYMNYNDVLKYKHQNSFDNEYISKSTLDLEEEIDRCYKNNFEKSMEIENRNLLSDSQQNINGSISSSCEVLTSEKPAHENVNQVHPEHKIYKPTTNFSIKNVLHRFKNKSPNKNSIDNEKDMNSNDHAPESTKSDVKSPTAAEKRSALNPRSYSKNLLQRFKSIIGDEPPENNQTKNTPQISGPVMDEVSYNKPATSEVKVVTTSTNSSVTSTIISAPSDLLSKSVCEDATLTEGQNGRNKIDQMFRSCENIKQADTFRPVYDKSISTITSTSVSSSPLKVRSDQNFNKLPIYKQGSKNLGARIAQSDYVDPQSLSLSNSKTTASTVNILINKNSLRPDSLLSNSSFVTSSSEASQSENFKGAQCSEGIDTVTNGSVGYKLNQFPNADESFYEKTFERIESLVDDDLFRHSVTYSDQEDSDDIKLPLSKCQSPQRNLSKLECIKSNTCFKTEFSAVKETEIKSSIKTPTKSFFERTEVRNSLKQKVAPPVPVKPKLMQPVINKPSLYPRILNRPSSYQREFLSETNISIPRSNVMKATARSESASSESVSVTDSSKDLSESDNEFVKSSKATVRFKSFKSLDESYSINSGDSTARASHNTLVKKTSLERKIFDATGKYQPVVENAGSKSVLERKMAIESMAKGPNRSSQRQIRPKQFGTIRPASTKISTYQRSVSEDKKETTTERSNIPKPGPKAPFKQQTVRSQEDKLIGNDIQETSWVKTIVNKFQ